MSYACTQIGFKSIPEVLPVSHKNPCLGFSSIWKRAILALKSLFYKFSGSSKPNLTQSKCYQLSLSINNVKNVFFTKNSYFSLRRLYYRLFVSLKPIMNSSTRYQLSSSVKNEKKRIFYEKIGTKKISEITLSAIHHCI